MKKGKLISMSDEALAIGRYDAHEFDESSPAIVLANFRRDWQPADAREDALVQLMAICFRDTVLNNREAGYAAISSFVILHDRLTKMQEFRRARQLDYAA